MVSKKNKNKVLINLTLFLIDQYFHKSIQINKNKTDFLLDIKSDINKNIFNLFQDRVENVKKTLREFLKNIPAKDIMGYGASTKGNTLLQYYGITPNLIKYAVERSEHKWGKYTIGSGLEIISEQKSRKLNPDYFYVMPYGFIDEFVKREKKMVRKRW